MEQTLGRRIAENRKRLKLTQDQLAEKLGVTAQAVSKWENDQSCPDITTLPRLAAIFSISTDALLGVDGTQIVHDGEVVDEECENNGIHIQKGNWEFRWDNGRRDSLGFAIFILCVGALYTLNQILSWELSLWAISWPTAILIFGVWGLLGNLSFFRLGCVLLGGYTLAERIFRFSFDINGKLVWALLILLFGASLLVDALKKPRRPKFSIHKASRDENLESSYYQQDGDTFTYRCSFGENSQTVTMQSLRYGDIEASFGNYTIDLSGVECLAPDCRIQAKCTFGELLFRVPRQYAVVLNHKSAFGDAEITGTPDSQPAGQIQIDGNVSFGEIEIQYI